MIGTRGTLCFLIVAQHMGIPARGYAETFAEAIEIATECADIAQPLPKIFEMDPVTYEVRKERRWVS